MICPPDRTFLGIHENRNIFHITYVIIQGIYTSVIIRQIFFGAEYSIPHAKLNASTIDENLLKWDKSFWNEYIDEPISVEDTKEISKEELNRSLIFNQ